VFPEGHALVVGIANYRMVSRLPVTILKDAADVERLLVSGLYCGYPAAQVARLLDGEATVDHIRAGLRRLAEKTGPGDTAVIYFSGHGARRGTDGSAYLIPYDCDPAKLESTALSGAELTKAFADIRAGRLVVMLDACHAAGAGELKAIQPAGTLEAGLDRKAIDALARGTGRVILCSSRTDEVSLVLPDMDNSLFTHYLLEALRGGAATRGDGLIRVFDVFEYVSDKVPARAPGQHPNFKAHVVESNFPLALDRGGPKSTGGGSTPTAPPLARRPKVLSGKAKLAILPRLLDRWKDLAEYFEIPDADRRTFEKGDEPRGVLSWLEQRDRLRELRNAFTYLGYDDLIVELDAHPT
jgi:hypothetical protein